MGVEGLGKGGVTLVKSFGTREAVELVSGIWQTNSKSEKGHGNTPFFDGGQVYVSSFHFLFVCAICVARGLGYVLPRDLLRREGI